MENMEMAAAVAVLAIVGFIISRIVKSRKSGSNTTSGGGADGRGKFPRPPSDQK